MSNYVTLLGAEQVATAASQMQSAASTISHAVGNLDYILHRHRLFMDDWLQRFEAMLAAAKETK